MYIVIVKLKLKDGVKDNFARWFTESNKTISKFSGFVSRRLIMDNDGNYRVLIEFQDKNSFTVMQQSSEHQELHKVGHAFLSEPPIRRDYKLVAE